LFYKLLTPFLFAIFEMALFYNQEGRFSLMIKDRGSKKWQGFFMPEHISLLKRLNEDYYKEPRPELVEGQIEEMEQLIISSLENNSLLEIKTWKNGFFTSRIGIVTKVDPIHKTIQIQDELDTSITINFFQIIEVKFRS
jgi:hypothetical protein